VPLKGLAEQWWLWWGGLQPDGREDCFLQSKDQLCWDDLNVAGINGIVSVVVSLLWWGMKVSEDEVAVKGWQSAIDDVCWVFSSMATDGSYPEGGLAKVALSDGRKRK
jgi:hypothetical protein